MCKAKKYKATSNVRIDKCMRNLIEFINKHTCFDTVSSCCGHNKYPMTILVKHKSYDDDVRLDIISGKVIRRKRNFYKRDKQGYYYIPEVLKR